MRVILASSNSHKLREVRQIWEHLGLEILAFSDLVSPFEICENGKSFKENALIKARAIFYALKNARILQPKDVILAEDSGLCVEILKGFPGIFSARFFELYKSGFFTECWEFSRLLEKIDLSAIESKSKNTDERNLFLLCEILSAISKEQQGKLKNFSANFCAAAALCVEFGGEMYEFSSHGFVFGKVLISPCGENGFGYDPIFVPLGFSCTTAMLSEEQKNEISHRKNALFDAEKIINLIKSL